MGIYFLNIGGLIDYFGMVVDFNRVYLFFDIWIILSLGFEVILGSFFLVEIVDMDVIIDYCFFVYNLVYFNCYFILVFGFRMKISKEKVLELFDFY